MHNIVRSLLHVILIEVNEYATKANVIRNMSRADIAATAPGPHYSWSFVTSI